MYTESDTYVVWISMHNLHKHKPSQKFISRGGVSWEGGTHNLAPTCLSPTNVGILLGLRKNMGILGKVLGGTFCH